MQKLTTIIDTLTQLNIKKWWKLRCFRRYGLILVERSLLPTSFHFELHIFVMYIQVFTRSSSTFPSIGMFCTQALRKWQSNENLYFAFSWDPRHILHFFTISGKKSRLSWVFKEWFKPSDMFLSLKDVWNDLLIILKKSWWCLWK